ncbi:MAG TPA: hypothetical protein VNC22_09470 [Sporichthya sp.]|jgi:hypothetical protein|nr:hypothetical protein [Sporichthya sp.]
MDLPVAIIILFIVVIVAMLAIYLIATIVELLKINAGLDQVLDKVGEIATKTAPVNGVLDAVNATLVAGRNLLEGLFYQKAGPDAAGLVESAFPGEGPRFLQRVGKSGTVVPIGEDYPRGAAILNSLLGVAPAPAAPAAAPAAASGPAESVRQGGRITLRGKSAPSSSATVADPPSEPGRLSARGSRPWER